MPDSPFDDTDLGGAVLVIAGFGAAGDAIAARLAGVVEPGCCLWGATPTTEVEGTVASADMVFIVTGLEDSVVAGRVARLAQVTRRAGVPTIVLVARSSVGGGVDLSLLDDAVDALLLLSPACLIQGDGTSPDLAVSVVEEYLVRLTAQSIITLISERGLICVDFADVKAILCSGRAAAAVGIGIDGGADGARQAAVKAVASLEAQGADLGRCGATLAIVAGSTNMTMDDFDAASAVLHDAVDEDVSIIVGVRVEDELGLNYRVLVLNKREKVKDVPVSLPKAWAGIVDDNANDNVL